MNSLNPYTHRLNKQSFASPFAELDKQLGSLFANLPALFDVQERAAARPSAVELRPSWYENAASYQARFDLPGVSKDAIAIDLEDGVLRVSAERSFAAAEGKEPQTLRYRAAVRVPEQVNNEGIAAAYENGVLSLTLPKAEKAKPRHIEIG